MTEVIPSINVRTFAEVKERITKIEPYVKWCHLDVTDGVFSKHLTWHDSRDLPLLAKFISDLSKSDFNRRRSRTSINIEVHLMVAEPEKLIDQWLVKPVKRVIVHLEAAKDLDLIIKKCRSAGIEVGLAINPETFWGKLEPWFEKVDIVQVLAVHPGPSGQEVDWPQMLGKIRHIRERCKGCIIEVDGGVNPETAKKAVEVGASLLVAGAYIFDSGDIQNAINNLHGAFT